MKLTAYNPSLDNTEKSYLSYNYPAGATAITLKNVDDFTSNIRILIGEMGRERSEIVTCSSVNTTDNILSISPTLFPHSVDDPIYVLKYDQITFYRSTGALDGTYSLLATVNIDVDDDEGVTDYEDPTGLTSYFYENTYYNSLTTLESDRSDPIPGTGYSRKQVGHILDDFFTEVGDLDQQYMNVVQAMNVMNECNDDLSTQSKKPYRTLKTKAILSLEAGNNRVSLPDNNLGIDRIRYNYVFGIENVNDDIQIIDIEEMDYIQHDNNYQPYDQLTRIAIDETTNELVIYPTPQTDQSGVLTVYYWKSFDNFSSLANSIELPTPRVYKLFLSARFYRMRGLHDESFLPLSDRYVSDYNTEVVKLQRINRVDKGSPMGYKPDLRNSRGLRRP